MAYIYQYASVNPLAKTVKNWIVTNLMYSSTNTKQWNTTIVYKESAYYIYFEKK